MMNSTRRMFLSNSLAAGVLLSSGDAWPQSYSSRPVRLIVPFPAGGVVDLYMSGTGPHPIILFRSR